MKLVTYLQRSFTALRHYREKSLSNRRGQIEVGFTVLITLIEIGDIKLLNVPALITLAPNAPLLLGQSALSKLGKFEFDYSNLTLTITGPKKFDFLKFNQLNQNVQKNYYVYKNSTLFSEDVSKDKKS